MSDDYLGDVNSAQKSVGPEIDSFQVTYGFSDQQRPFSNLVLPKRRLNHPDQYLITNGCDESIYTCCDPGTQTCANWGDIADVKFDVVLRTRIPDNISIITPPGGKFNVENHYLKFRDSFVVVPGQYTNSSGSVGIVGQDADCPLNKLSSRCKPSCSHVFDNHNPVPQGNVPPPDWEGYGRDISSPNPSAYCMCGQDPGNSQFKDYLSDPGQLDAYAWNAIGDNNRINACVRAFGCARSLGQTSRLMQQHPGDFLACNCANNPDDFLEYNPNTVEYSILKLESPDPDDFNLGSDPATNNLLKCDNWESCDDKATIFYQANPPVTDWDTACTCRTFQKDTDGNDTDNKVDRSSLKWASI